MEDQKDDKSLPFVNAHIASHDGWNEIIFSLRRIFLGNQRKLTLSSIEIKGDNWDVEKRLAPSPRYDLSRHVVVELKQILLSEEGLIALTNNLGAWLNNPFSFELNIAEGNENEVWVFVGPRDDFISSLDRPVFSFKYISSRMKGEWSFVTDQSCLNILLKGLSAYLEIDSLRSA